MSARLPKALEVVRNGIRDAISGWLTDPDGEEMRIRKILTRIVEGALEDRAWGPAVAAITMALRFGPGEVTRQEVEHSGKVTNENVLILPTTLPADEWQKKHQETKPEPTH